MIGVCFVCLGNICRSPIGEAVFRHLVNQAGLSARFEIDSAGTAGYHIGEPPDHRARAAGERAGIEVSGAARQFHAADFARFDYVIAMDSKNHADLLRLAGSAEARAKVRSMRGFDPDAPSNAPVPDPYYGADSGFDEVLQLCLVAGRGLLAEIRRVHGV